MSGHYSHTVMNRESNYHTGFPVIATGEGASSGILREREREREIERETDTLGNKRGGICGLWLGGRV